jgi:hypothetical protein
MTDSAPPVAVVARAAYLRAGGLDWADIADKLARTKPDTEALARHDDWHRLYRLAARTVAREAEADARYHRRRALRSPDEAEATTAAEEAYKLRAQRRPKAKPAPPSERNQLVRAYLDCLNAMSVEEFLALEAAEVADSNVTPP